MSNQIVTMTEEQFEAKYKPQINHLERKLTPSNIADEDICSFGGCMYETYGDDLAYVMEMVKHNRVVTIIEGEDEKGEDGEMHSTIYYASGLHVVNKIGFLVVDKMIDIEFDIKLNW